MSRSPSVLWVNHYALSPREGGGTRHFELGRELVGRGWEVTIAAADFHHHLGRYVRRSGESDRAVVDEQIDGVDFRWLWTRPHRKNDWRRAVNWLSFAYSLEGLRRGSPSVVIGSSPHLFAAWGAQRLARRLGVPFVLEVRDLWPESLLAVRPGKGPGYHALDRLARHLYARADHILVLARGTGSYLERERGIDPARITYVPNGVDPAAFAGLQRPARDTFTVLYAGAHGPANGLEAVLDAAERLRGEAGIRFLLVGDGPAKAGLQESARGRGLANVEFRAPVPKERLRPLFAEADAGLMVLRDAPLFAFGVSPNKLFDYLGASLPVVCNVPGEVAEMLRSASAGEQAANASGAALADAIVRMRAHPAAERERMGGAGAAWVAREHGRPVVAERLDRVLRSLLR